MTNDGHLTMLPPSRKIRVLIADDSALMRRELRKLLESDPAFEVLEAARDGQEAVDKAKRLAPDVVALDINMPVMDGLTALQLIMMESPCPVVMISSLTMEGALTSYEALELGAVDFIGKPGGTISKNIDQIAFDIIAKLKAAASARMSNIRIRRKPQRYDTTQKNKPAAPKGKGKIVIIGQSTGGPNVIMDIIPAFPADLGVPVIIIQHMPANFTSSFASRLDQYCALPFKEVAAGDIITAGQGYLAKGDVNMILVPRGMGKPGEMVRLTHTPDTLHKPSVNVAMDSVLKLYGANTIGVLLTGMGDDGADAMVAIRGAGGRTIAESEETCVVFGMPKEAIMRGGAEFVLPSHKIGEKIVALVRER